MEEKAPRCDLKRKFLEDEDSNKPPAPQKRASFPKGKEEPEAMNQFDHVELEADLKDPRIAAKERAKRRNQIITELFTEELSGVAEVAYGDNDEKFNEYDDGIVIEPFNLNKESEEGYFDANGNYVEYVKDKEIEDAWAAAFTNYDQDQDLDIGIIKRRIANVLEHGETVLQALKRLKGTNSSNNRKEKMPTETKLVFDQLTEDAMNLMMRNGDYNVYHKTREVFQFEAEASQMLLMDTTTVAIWDVINYDPSTGLYCTAASAQWSLNEATGTYDQVHEATEEFVNFYIK
ncbi:hypothetical protein COLO4_15286 [Corchorus olitorius]|uniref:CD2 antigen cytoplasmic tail-binding protein 2 n=1 Tax=Corchorus olitorius TaxID=93759 RepID=A0A1R3JNG0_9ROSI|nr:hypothetical protein COLO4_15286 [Corchorus olitorius]